MSNRIRIEQYLQRYPAIGTAIYGVVMLALAVTGWLCVADTLDHRASLVAANDILASLERHWPGPPGGTQRTMASAPAGSPFIEGHTVTVAGAGLLQRVSRAIAQVGGRVISSQVDLQGVRSKQGYITVIINCELDLPGLQKMLYDVEAGLPFLFVDQLTVQASGPSTTPEAARMHVLLSASGQWLGRR